VIATIFFDFVTMVAIINPIEAAAVFATLTGGFTDKERAAIALRSSLVAGAILIGFGLVGQALLSGIGVSFAAFRIAGGALLLKVGFNMVFAKETGTQRLDAAERTAAAQTDDPSVFPLAIPIITGPGALTTIVALLAKRAGTPLDTAFVILASLVVIGLTYAAMRASTALTAVLGPTGVNAVGRIMGILLAAIAVQLMIVGVQTIFPALAK
jgi:multiple antibiotic resistance protein